MIGSLLIGLAFACEVGDIPYIEVSSGTSGRFGVSLRPADSAEAIDSAESGTSWRAWLDSDRCRTPFGYGVDQGCPEGEVDIMLAKNQPAVDCSAGTATITLTVTNQEAAAQRANISVWFRPNGIPFAKFYPRTIGVLGAAGFWLVASDDFSWLCSQDCLDNTAWTANETADSLDAYAVARQYIAFTWKEVEVPGNGAVSRSFTLSFDRPDGITQPVLPPSQSPAPTPWASGSPEATLSPAATSSPCPAAYWIGGAGDASHGYAFWGQYYDEAGVRHDFHTGNGGIQARVRRSNTTTPYTFNSGVLQASAATALGLLGYVTAEPIEVCADRMAFIFNVTNNGTEEIEFDLGLGLQMPLGTGTAHVLTHPDALTQLFGFRIAGPPYVALLSGDVEFQRMRVATGTSLNTWYMDGAFPGEDIETPRQATMSWMNIAIPAGASVFRRMVLRFLPGGEQFATLQPAQTFRATPTACPRPYFWSNPWPAIHQEIHDEEGEGENATRIIVGNGAWSVWMRVPQEDDTFAYRGMEGGVINSDDLSVTGSRSDLARGHCGDDKVTYELRVESQRTGPVQVVLQVSGNVLILGDDKPPVSFLPNGGGLYWQSRSLAVRPADAESRFSTMNAYDLDTPRSDTFANNQTDGAEGDVVNFAWTLDVTPGQPIVRKFVVSKYLPEATPEPSAIPATEGEVDSSDGSGGLSSGAIAGIAVAAVVVAAAAAIGAFCALCKKKDGAPVGDEDREVLADEDGEPEGAGNEEGGSAQEPRRRRKKHAEADQVQSGEEKAEGA